MCDQRTVVMDSDLHIKIKAFILNKSKGSKDLGMAMMVNQNVNIEGSSFFC